MTLRSSSAVLLETTKSVPPRLDRLPPIPGPGLDPVAHRVVKDRDHVQLIGLVLGHVLLERYVIRSDDRELLGRNAVALRRVAVALDRRSQPVPLSGRQNHVLTQVRRQRLLEDPPVSELDALRLISYFSRSAPLD